MEKGTLGLIESTIQTDTENEDKGGRKRRLKKTKIITWKEMKDPTA